MKIEDCHTRKDRKKGDVRTTQKPTRSKCVQEQSWTICFKFGDNFYGWYTWESAQSFL